MSICRRRASFDKKISYCSDVRRSQSYDVVWNSPVGADSRGAAGKCPGTRGTAGGHRYHFIPLLFCLGYNFNSS